MNLIGMDRLLANGVLAHPIMETDNGGGERTLLYYTRLHDMINQGLSSEDLSIEMMGHHMSIASALAAYGRPGLYAIEVSLAGLTTHNEFYSGLAWTMLRNGISMKMHIVLSDDDIHNQYNHHDTLKRQLSLILATGMTFALENISCIEHFDLANEILEIANEVRVDWSRDGYVDLCQIQESLGKMSDHRRIQEFSSKLSASTSAIFSYSLIN